VPQLTGPTDQDVHHAGGDEVLHRQDGAPGPHLHPRAAQGSRLFAVPHEWAGPLREDGRVLVVSCTAPPADERLHGLSPTASAQRAPSRGRPRDMHGFFVSQVTALQDGSPDSSGMSGVPSGPAGSPARASLRGLPCRAGTPGWLTGSHR
jgi:hypothetical protein